MEARFFFVFQGICWKVLFVENIINYLNNRKTSHLAALSGTIAGKAALLSMQEKLRLASDELHRMEYESGISLNERQNLVARNYFKASKRLKNILSNE